MIAKDNFSIVLIGAGNVATNLGKVLLKAGFSISQVYSRTESSAKELADDLGCDFTVSIEGIKQNADLYIVSLTDAAFERLLPDIVRGRERALFVHTAGSVPMDIWKGYLKHYGVLYPLQTFSKKRIVDFAQVPLFIEADNENDLSVLKEIAIELSTNVQVINSEQRRSLHIAAVFACNFTNHMYVLAEQILQKHNLPFELILPLIQETAEKVQNLSPEKAQTGPAVRYDKNVMDKHLELLNDLSYIKEVYEILSKGIYENVSKK